MLINGIDNVAAGVGLSVYIWSGGSLREMNVHIRNKVNVRANE